MTIQPGNFVQLTNFKHPTSGEIIDAMKARVLSRDDAGMLTLWLTDGTETSGWHESEVRLLPKRA